MSWTADHGSVWEFWYLFMSLATLLFQVPSPSCLHSSYTHSLFRFNHPVPLPLTYNLCLVAYIPSIWCSSLFFLMKFNFSFKDWLQCCCIFPWLIGWQIRRDLSDYFEFLLADKHWVGQQVHSGFSIMFYRKTWANLLANPIFSKATGHIGSMC